MAGTTKNEILRVFYFVMIIFALVACAGSNLADPPQHVQYVYRNDLGEGANGFYGVDSVTNKRYLKFPTNDGMNGAQCLTMADYKKMESYVDYLEKQARDRCK